MDRIFLDTNVLIDYLVARKPFDDAAKKLFQCAETGQIELYTSVLSICNLAYIIRKMSPTKDINQLLYDLTKLLTLIPIDNLIINDAFSSAFKDFEDAVQYFSAFRFGGITHILTRNEADFTESLIMVSSPSEYLSSNF